MDRLELRKIIQEPGIAVCRTSGSTGIAVEVQKYQKNIHNMERHTRLFNLWHNWDKSAKTLKIKPNVDKPHWQGNTYLSSSYVEGDFEQIISNPMLFPDDMSQFKRIVSYGGPWQGRGIDLYSSEEFGYIAIQCPFNRNALHIMSNLKVEYSDRGLIITDHDHPYLKNYEIGDWASPVECDCSIGTPAMSHVQGRIRNMMKMPDGTTKWPLFGLHLHFNIIRYQVFQESLTKLRLHYTGRVTDESLKAMNISLGYDFEIELVEGNFKDGKFEEFICEI